MRGFGGGPGTVCGVFAAPPLWGRAAEPPLSGRLPPSSACPLTWRVAMAPPALPPGRSHWPPLRAAVVGGASRRPNENARPRPPPLLIGRGAAAGGV